VLAQIWGAATPEEDPVGTLAELDFRLAVLAQHLDRSYPVSRPLLAGRRERLAAFAASTEFAACFGDAASRRSVVQAFGAFARRCLRESPDEAGAAALAVESFLLAASERGGQAAAARALPLDLTEARFAARSLKRHLADRAWITGQIDPAGLDALRQVVLRGLRALGSSGR
jgi:uncharacterized protein